jgi:hypothetical protein
VLAAAATLSPSLPLGQSRVLGGSYELKLESLAGDVSAWSVNVEVSAELMTRLMEQDVTAQQDYLDRVRQAQGQEAALRAEAGIRAPYSQRLRELATAAAAPVIEVPMVTLGGRLSFSAVSFDGALTPKDPVSVLFYGDGRADSLYSELTRMPTCAPGACPPRQPAFIDHDGLAGLDGLRPCHSQTQWVLMAMGGSVPEWRRNSRGLMLNEGGCASGTRDHVRLYNAQADPVFGEWSVATPHREDWTDRGHVVRGWDAPAVAFVRAVAAGANLSTSSTGLEARPWLRCNAGWAGLYQDVPFSGDIAIVPLP